MSDTMILLVGITVFGLMIVAVILTIVEFRQLPRHQEPQFENVAPQAQPDPVDERELRSAG